MSVLPLSWLISIWKNIPEFWNQKVPEVISDFGYFLRIPIPRGPFSCDRHFKQLTKGKFFFNNNNVPRAGSSRSKFVYMTKSSFHNQPAIRSSLTYLYSSRPMPLSTKEVPRPEIVKQEIKNIVNVKEFSRSSSPPVQAELSPARPAGPPLLDPGALIAVPTERAEERHQNYEDGSCQCTEDSVCNNCLSEWLY